MTDQTLLEQIQLAMLEPTDGGQSWPSDLWSFDEVIQYVNQRQSRFLRSTQMYVSYDTIGVVSGAYGNRFPLPDDWLATIRILWEDENGSIKDLIRADSWVADHGYPTWETQATPKVYMDQDAPLGTLQVAPTPDLDGTLHVWYIAEPPAVDGNGTDLLIADEFASTIKYGTMADMLSKIGRAGDPRAKYCNERYNLGIEVAQMLLKGIR